MKKLIPVFFFALFYLLPAPFARAQHFLSRKISIEARNQSVSEVLRTAEKQGGFFFSFNSSLIPEDSLVTLSIRDKSVDYLLKLLFGNRFRYDQHGRYLIIQPVEEGNSWIVSGIVQDKHTGERISNVTVYEKQQLVSAMSDSKGYFQLQLKEGVAGITIHVSKLSYKDTLVHINDATPQPISISLSPVSYLLDSIVVSNHIIEHSWIGRMLLSSRLRMNSLNLGGFLASRPYQFSLIPGLGSHGKMGTQVVNKFSFNLLGGYTSGVNGFELGGLFNIVKNDMRYVEIGGLFNFVGNNATGVQLAGLVNKVLDSTCGLQVSGLTSFGGRYMKGAQIGGVYNQAGNIHGVQIAGLLNLASKTASGLQLAGVGNYASDISGLQISGIMNFSKKSSTGLQLGGICNYAGSANGVQFALINIADTLPGYSFGLINIIRSGYHKLSISYDESNYLNLAFRSGNPRLYNILKIGTSLSREKIYSIGYGLGRETDLSKRLGFNPEFVATYFYPGDWEQGGSSCRFQFNFRYHIGPLLTLSAGPAYSFNYAFNDPLATGSNLPDKGNYPKTQFSKYLTGWLGWNIALEFF